MRGELRRTTAVAMSKYEGKRTMTQRGDGTSGKVRCRNAFAVSGLGRQEPVGIRSLAPLLLRSIAAETDGWGLESDDRDDVVEYEGKQARKV
jgi:hypothetical protein